MARRQNGKYKRRGSKRKPHPYRRLMKTKNYSDTYGAVLDRLKFPEKVKDSISGGEMVDDYELTGAGRFGCVYCDRLFVDSRAADQHLKSKPHKRAIRHLVKNVPYSHKEAKTAAGHGSYESSVQPEIDLSLMDSRKCDDGREYV